jgi:hypothetical protein
VRPRRSNRQVQPIGDRQQDLDQVTGVDLGRPVSLIDLALYRRGDRRNRLLSGAVFCGTAIRAGSFCS